MLFTDKNTYPNLEIGDKGNFVVSWQNYLQSKGYNCGKNKGVFDILMKEAVCDYQITRNIFPSGIIDDETWDSLEL